MDNNNGIIIKEYNLTNYVCPLSKVKAFEAMDRLNESKKIKLILGDIDSLKSVVQEIKSRGLKPSFHREDDSRFVLIIGK